MRDSFSLPVRRLYLAMLFSWLFSWLFSCSPRPPAKPDPARLRPGDLVFQRLRCGDLCEAIALATRIPGVPVVSHVGVVERVEGDRVVLLEAYDHGVARVDLKDFMARSARENPPIIVARLKPPHDAMIPFWLEEIRARLGKPYDDQYLPDNGAYYCSELLSDAMLSLGVHIFDRIPMNFGAPGSWERRIWEEYYRELGMKVPQGMPGTNPIHLLASPYLERVDVFPVRQVHRPRE